MSKKIIGIFVCILMIATAIPVVGQIKTISNCDNYLDNTQENIKTWIKTLGGKGYDIGYSVQQTSDGGYIIVGSTESYSTGEGTDVWLIKTDINGDELWNKTFGILNDTYERGIFVIQTADNGFIIATNFWLFKTDENGNEEWHVTSSGNSVCQTDDGGFTVVGGYNSCLWIFKIDSNGKWIWEKKYKEIVSEGYSIKQTSDQGYIIAGDHCILKTDENGEKNWIITLDSDMRGRDALQNRDGNYAAIGWRGNWPRDDSGWLIRIDNNGNILSRKDYSSFFNSYLPYNFYQTSDGGYIITGEVDTYSSPGLIKMRLWLAKTDDYGDLIWSKRYGGYDYDFGTSVQETSDGGYVVVGGTNSYGAGSIDVWFIKTNNQGKLKTISSGNMSFEKLVKCFSFFEKILKQ